MLPVAIALWMLPSPGAPTLVTLPEIDRRCDAAEKVGRSKPDRIFADVSEETGPRKSRRGTWREFRDAAGLKGATPQGPPNTQAFVWRYPDGVTYLQMVFQSRSGDWMRFADHCFRPDGTLARVRDALNSFEGGRSDSGISQVRIKYLSRDGQVLKMKARVVDLETGEPVKGHNRDGDDAAYLRLSDAPFFDLLNRPVSAP
jgi:hypothetical protein